MAMSVTIRDGGGEVSLPACRPHARMDGMTAGGTRPWSRVSMAEIKVVGKSGQISLGKSYAGKALRVERREDGSIVLTSVALGPESQLWTLEEPHRSRIARGLAWATESKPDETDVDALLKRRMRVGGRTRGRGR